MEAAIVIAALAACMRMAWNNPQWRPLVGASLRLYMLWLSFPSGFAVAFCSSKSDANPETCGMLCALLLAMIGLITALAHSASLRAGPSSASLPPILLVVGAALSALGVYCGILIAPLLHN
jgi:hypothetical protein